MQVPPLRSTLFPYTTLFRSQALDSNGHVIDTAGGIEPGSHGEGQAACGEVIAAPRRDIEQCADSRDRKSTRLNSSHANISYAVFCLKKKRQRNALETAVHCH